MNWCMVVAWKEAKKTTLARELEETFERIIRVRASRYANRRCERDRRRNLSLMIPSVLQKFLERCSFGSERVSYV